MATHAPWRARIFGIGTLLFALTPLASAQTLNAPGAPATTRRPNEFGTHDYTVMVIPASAFTSDTDTATDFGSLFRYFAPRNTAGGHFFHGVEVPSGAVIDFVGLETQDNGYNAYQANLYYVDQHSGTTSGLVSIDFGPFGHYGYDTTYNTTALGWQLVQNSHNALVIDVYQAPYDCPGGCERLISFGWVEIWWKRAVSPPPATATFNDVPSSDFGFQYIEALAASGITAGCAGGNYCPDANLTRRQMAVFLAKALGLHWPY